MDRFEEARAGLEAARRHYREGSQDRLLGARLLEVDANIHGDRGEFAEALASLDRALRVYRCHGDPHLAGRSLIINFPGNPKAIGELFPVVAPVLEHAVATLRREGGQRTPGH